MISLPVHHALSMGFVFHLVRDDNSPHHSLCVQMVETKQIQCNAANCVCHCVNANFYSYSYRIFLQLAQARSFCRTITHYKIDMMPERCYKRATTRSAHVSPVDFSMKVLTLPVRDSTDPRLSGFHCFAVGKLL